MFKGINVSCGIQLQSAMHRQMETSPLGLGSQASSQALPKPGATAAPDLDKSLTSYFDWKKKHQTISHPRTRANFDGDTCP